MSELETAPTKQEVADLLTIVLIEAVAALTPDSRTADEKLEDIAGRLLTMADGLTDNPGSASLIRATAQQLIQTEAGTG